MKEIAAQTFTRLLDEARRLPEGQLETLHFLIEVELRERDFKKVKNETK